MLIINMISRGCCIKSRTRIPVRLLNAKFYLNLSGELPRLQILVESVKQEVSLETCIPRHLLLATTGSRTQVEIIYWSAKSQKVPAASEAQSEAKKVQTDVVFKSIRSFKFRNP